MTEYYHTKLDGLKRRRYGNGKGMFALWYRER